MRRQREECGFTIVELLVVLALMSIVTVTLYAFMYRVSGATTRTQKDVRAEETIEFGLRTITQDLRSASALSACVSGTYASCVVIDVPRTASPALACPLRRVTYALSSGSITRTVVTYSSSCTASTTVNAKAIVSSVTGTTLFSYFDKSGNTIDPVASASSVPSSASAKVTISVSYGGSTTPTLTLSSVAALRNSR